MSQAKPSQKSISPEAHQANPPTIKDISSINIITI